MKVKPAIYTILLFTCAFMFTRCSNGGITGEVSPDITPPAKVIITGITTSQDHIDLTWTDPADSDLDHVQIACSEGTTVNIACGTGACTISGLTSDTLYTITLCAADSMGNLSEPNTFTVTTTTGGIIEFSKIYTPDDLNAVGTSLNGHYILMSDIDLDGYTAGEGWPPIGDSAHEYVGTFNGNGFVIKNLYINRPGVSYQGLFGDIGSGGRVENLGIEDNDVTGKYYTGGMVGNNEGKITNCYATGSVSGYEEIGGLVGDNHGTISNCHATGDVDGVNQYIGGLAGANYSGTVENCYATGDVSGTADFTGGLVGFNVGTISNSYATGTVGGNVSIGGIVGLNQSEILNSYAIGEVNGTDFTGGLVGYNNDGTVTASFFFQLPDNSIGNFVSESDMKLQKTYTGWDFTDIWGIDSGTNSGYPWLL